MPAEKVETAIVGALREADPLEKLRTPLAAARRGGRRRRARFSRAVSDS